MSKFEIYVTAADQGQAMSDALPAWLTFWASVVTALVWPLTVIVVVLLLRQNIPQLFAALKRLSGLGFEAEFARTVQDLEGVVSDRDFFRVADAANEIKTVHESHTDRAPEAPQASQGTASAGEEEKSPRDIVMRRFPGNEKVQSSAQARIEGLQLASQLAAESPHAAVVVAWRELSLAMRTVGQAKGIPKVVSERHLIKRLTDMGVLSRDMADTIIGLRALRTRVSYEPDFKPDQQAVDAYVEVASEATGYLYGSAFPAA